LETVAQQRSPLAISQIVLTLAYSAVSANTMSCPSGAMDSISNYEAKEPGSSLDSGANCFGNDVAFYPNSLIFC